MRQPELSVIIRRHELGSRGLHLVHSAVSERLLGNSIKVDKIL